MPAPSKDQDLKTADRFRALARAGRYEEAFEAGEAILNSGATLQALMAFWHPWQPEDLDLRRHEHIRILERLVRATPDAPWAHYYLGNIREDALALRRAAAFPEKRYGWMYFKLGHVYLSRCRFGPALYWLRRALRYKPVDWRIHGFLAETLLCLGRAREAFREMDRARRIAPPDEAAQVLAWRGAFNLWLGRYDQAYRELDEACNRGALWAQAWRGGVKVKLGRPQEALKDLDKAIRLYPADLEAYVWRGEAKRELGLHEEALRDLSRKPLSLWAHVNRALIMAALKDHGGMDEEWRSLPDKVLAYLKKKLRLNLRRRLTVSEKVAVLTAGLRLSHGYRHRNPRGNAIWML